MEAGGQLEVDSDIMTLSTLIKVATARKKKRHLVTQVCERCLI